MNAGGRRNPPVFTAYAQDSQEHKDAVRRLADLLRSFGVDAEIDQYAEQDRQDWYSWAHRHITESDFVLVVASARMRAVGDGNAPSNQNRGVQTELQVIRDLLHRDRSVWTRKILPVILPGGQIGGIPDFLGPYALSRYEVTELTRSGIDSLLRVITGQPKIVRPPLGPLPDLPAEPPPASRVEPDWQVLPQPADVSWRSSIMTLNHQWTAQWPATLEVHLAPVDDSARLPANRLRTIGGQLAGVLRGHGLVPESGGVDSSASDKAVQATSYHQRNQAGSGLAALRNGQRSAWQTLPNARIGTVLIPADAVDVITMMVRILLELGGTMPARFAPTVGIDPATLLRIGERADLTSSSGSLPMGSIEQLLIDAEESVSVDDLIQAPHAIAEELVARLVGAFHG